MAAYPKLWRDPRLPDRIWDKYKIDRTGPKWRGSYCWIKLGYLDRKGYGRVYYDGMMRLAHRVFYEVLVGPLPPFDGSNPLDHRCRRPACANPAHLELVTAQVNMARGVGRAHAGVLSRMTTGLCPRGHNSWRRDPRHPNSWTCRECILEAQRKKRRGEK